MFLQRESFTDGFVDEVLPMLMAHWAEIAHYDDITLAPDWDAYAAMDQSGMLRIYTARDAELSLLGYVVYVVRPAPHYSGSIQAVQDVLYLDPSSRGQMFGAKLLAFSHTQLADEHVQVVYQHVKLAHDFGRLLERLGYEPIERIFAKRLDT